MINQYMKQSRIEGYFEGDTFVRTSTDPVKLILKDQISEQELESLKSELVEKGLGNEIDWHKVASDLSSMNVGFDNIENFEKNGLSGIPICSFERSYSNTIYWR